ncbi:hypothetical protein BD311DRAFT_738095 [Dichomitus squalens]|uniref:Uncharacterized protein n=1 Tax=Dichomitus squalens TaxID=114155 RepID=A0A4Q9MRV7_9APHY|nr:hypothetical protein BD311DRAFT_738095 [Dichomitus squalens]
MRLLDTHTGQFVQKDPKDPWIRTEFAILSHTWNDAGEQDFQQLSKIQERYAAKPHPPPNNTESRLPAVEQRPLAAHPPAPPHSPHLARTPSSPSAVSPGIPFPDERTALLPRSDRTSRMEQGFANEDISATSNPENVPISHSFRRILQLLLCVLKPVYWLVVRIARCQLHVTTPTSVLAESHHTPDVGLMTPERPAEPASDLPTPPILEDLVERPLDIGAIWNDPELSPKIREACRVAREAGYRYLWIDSCCIDKASSSELTESINSMYLWYGLAQVCYAYLVDVPSDEDPREDESAFRKSRWHERGWTLQELIAPPAVIFLAKDWKTFGTKLDLRDLVEEITGIPEEALLHVKSLDEFSVAQRLSWAARRQTSRKEDRAYSLLGVFNINMPTLYGEGSRAFRRLQEEIVRRIPDLSLFAWNRHIYRGCNPNQDLVQALENAQSFTKLTSSSTPFDSDISDFESGEKIRAIAHDDLFHRLKLKDLPAPEYTFTPHGIRSKLPVVPLSIVLPKRPTDYDPDAPPHSQWYLVILGCEHDDYPGALLGQVCYIPPSESGVEYLYYGFVEIRPPPDRGPHYSDLFPLSPATIARCREHIAVKTVYISKPEHAPAQSQHARRQRHKTLNLLLLKKTRDALRAQGYTAELRGPDEGHRTTHWLTLSNDDHRIAVEYQHTLEDKYYIQRLRIEANVKVLQPAPGLVEEMEVFSGSMEWRDWIGPHHRWLKSPRIDSASDQVVFTLAAKRLTVQLAFDWAAPSIYILRVEVVTKTLQDTAPTSPKSAQAEGLQAAGADDEQGAQVVEAEAEGSGGGVHNAADDARLGALDSEGGAGGPEAGSGGEEDGARSESHGWDVDGEAEGEEGTNGDLYDNVKGIKVDFAPQVLASIDEAQ